MPKVPKIRSLHIFAICQEIYTLIASIWVCIAGHAQSTQNNKVAIFLFLIFLFCLQYLKEKVKVELDFLPPNKHQRILQIDSIILGMFAQTCPDYPK